MRTKLKIPQQKKISGFDLISFFETWCRGTESNCRHGDFQTKFLKIQKCCNSKQVILFRFFQLTFGFVWNCLGIFDLDGHNLGTIFHRNPIITPQAVGIFSKLDCARKFHKLIWPQHPLFINSRTASIVLLWTNRLHTIDSSNTDSQSEWMSDRIY